MNTNKTQMQSNVARTKIILFLFGLIFVAPTIVGQDKLLPIVPNAVSPNGQFEIAVLDNKKHPLSYALVDNRSKKVLAKVPSSYRDTTADRTWALEQTRQADIYWHPSNSLVIIDEQSHRYIGTVHILAISPEGEVSEIPLPDISELTPRVSWDRVRVRVEPPGWTRGKELLLLVGGRAVTKDEPRTMKWRSYDVLLEISDKATIRSIKRM